jgi:ABC-2 type transport system ATP-binding protein
MIRLDGLVKSYGTRVRAVDNLSLEIRRGEIFGFLGPNGAGKTTTISMLCGFLAPDEGRILFEGEQVSAGRAAWRDRLGYCPQELVIWERLTLAEQTEYVGRLYGLASSLIRERTRALLGALGLLEKRDSLARTLSGGMKRRLNLVLALVHDPDLVVLDEPEAGLDPQSRLLMRELIRSLAEKDGKTVILTTHNLDEAERLSHRVAIIDHGRLLALDSPDALISGGGAEQSLEMEFESAAACERAAAQTGFAAAGNVLTRRAPRPEMEIASILERLGNVGLRPKEVRFRRRSLEDVFIDLTGRSLRE